MRVASCSTVRDNGVVQETACLTTGDSGMKIAVRSKRVPHSRS